MAGWRPWHAIAAAVALVAWPVAAQTVVRSDAPDKSAVTVYRDPDRGSEATIDARFPGGFALITETRRLRLPAGRVTVRFEGVSRGIVPESAILRGLPVAARERNLDADLLSPRALYDRSTGRQVTIRRTDRATGAVTTEPAVIRSGGEGAAVIETARGVESVGCTGLAETIVYDGVPAGLPARPTLAAEIDVPAAVDAVVSLSYLAAGFDWQADHVVTLLPDGSARWFGWATLVSGDTTSYPQADTQLIAGRLNREAASDARDLVPEGALNLQCWSEASAVAPPPPPPPAPPPPAPAMMERAMAADIVVTGARVAALEALGDLKLYRVPQPVTVAAQAQKQVALIDRGGVRLDRLYVTRGTATEPGNTLVVLRARNRSEAGLGLPLPQGKVAVFEQAGQRELLIGEARIEDRAVGDRVELELGGGGDVGTDTQIARRGGARLVTLTVRNATPRPIIHELRLALTDEERRARVVARLPREDGFSVWRARVPANGTARLRYWLSRDRAPDRVRR